MTNRFICALGMMSGTSLDGVDAAQIITDGETIADFGPGGYCAYSPEEAAILRAALGRWPGPRDGIGAGIEAGTGAGDGTGEVGRAAALSVLCHAKLARDFPQAALIGYHGQTLAHDPHGRGTHQAGSGAALARLTGRPVVWDFRSEDVRRGGEGAPLAPFFHWACAAWAIRRGGLAPAPVAFLNLGGVGNLTWVDPQAGGPDAPGACLAFDTGPANAPLNDLMRHRRGQDHDEGGALALSGRADPAILAEFLRHPYFERPPPKSLDRDEFSQLLHQVADLPDGDAAATLAQAAAAAVAAGMARLPAPPATLLVCGGGRHNRAMMAALQDRIHADVRPVESAGLDGDLLEAQAFGWLAVRVLRGMPTSGPGTTGVPLAGCGGRISAAALCPDLRHLIG